MRNLKTIKTYWRKRIDESFVEFIEYLENDLKEWANLIDYNYKFSSLSSTNIHNYVFEITQELLTNEDIRKIENIINTYDEGSITFGRIFLGSIYVTIIGDS